MLRHQTLNIKEKLEGVQAFERGVKESALAQFALLTAVTTQSSVTTTGLEGEVVVVVSGV